MQNRPPTQPYYFSRSSLENFCLNLKSLVAQPLLPSTPLGNHCWISCLHQNPTMTASKKTAISSNKTSLSPACQCSMLFEKDWGESHAFLAAKRPASEGWAMKDQLKSKPRRPADQADQGQQRLNKAVPIAIVFLFWCSKLKTRQCLWPCCLILIGKLHTQNQRNWVSIARPLALHCLEQIV